MKNNSDINCNTSKFYWKTIIVPENISCAAYNEGDEFREAYYRVLKLSQPIPFSWSREIREKVGELRLMGVRNSLKTCKALHKKINRRS